LYYLSNYLFNYLPRHRALRSPPRCPDPPPREARLFPSPLHEEL